jgi:hypothetical protein
LVVIESASPPLRVKLQGDVDTDPQTGQITAVFDDLPQLPFTSFTLRFRGGDNAVLTAPPGCGTHTATARLTPWSAPASPATRTAGFATVACGPPAFAPTLDAGVSPTTAGRGTALTLAIERPDGHARLRSLRISLPPGLVGSLAAVKPCALERALAAACPDSSGVGSATAVAGTGPTPAALAGAVYLTGPVGTAPAGLVRLGLAEEDAPIEAREQWGLEVRVADQRVDRAARGGRAPEPERRVGAGVEPTGGDPRRERRADREGDLGPLEMRLAPRLLLTGYGQRDGELAGPVGLLCRRRDPQRGVEGHARAVGRREGRAAGRHRPGILVRGGLHRGLRRLAGGGVGHERPLGRVHAVEQRHRDRLDVDRGDREEPWYVVHLGVEAEVARS